MAEWMEIVIEAGEARADEVAGLIAARVTAAEAGVQIRGGEVVLWVPTERAEAALAEARQAAAALAGLDGAAVRLQPAAPEAEWRDAWKRHFHAERVTPRIVIVPSWEQHAAAAGDVVIDLDPGQAFGTGAHASTQLVLLLLDELAGEGAAVERFLDLGTGSGILAIAAAKLWPAARGLAVDNDPIAVRTAGENAAHNGVAERVACAGTPLAELSGPFALVVANLQADVLRALREPLSALVAPSGRLLLSGLLTEQAAQLGIDYAAGGFDFEELRRCARDPEWSAVRLRRLAR